MHHLYLKEGIKFDTSQSYWQVFLPFLGALVWLRAFFFIFLHDLNVEIYFSAVEGGFFIQFFGWQS